MRATKFFGRTVRRVLAIGGVVAVLLTGAVAAQATTTTVGDIAQLNPDGTLNTAFNFGGAGFSPGTVYAIVEQPDGSFLIGGSFTSYNGTAVAQGLVHLSSTGVLDTAFNANLGSGFDQYVFAVKLQSDGKILIGGNFSNLNGVATSRFVRLNADGTVDASFKANIGTGPNLDVNTIDLQADGTIVLGGAFTSFNGIPSVNRIAKVDSTGVFQSAFTTNIGSGFNAGTVRAIITQPDNKLLVGGGGYTSFNGGAVSTLIRLNADGSLDTSFNNTANFNYIVYALELQASGNIIAGGTFTKFNGVSLNVGYLARLSPTGALDQTFESNIGGAGPISAVVSLGQQADGSILVGGLFTYFNTVPTNRLAKVSSTGVPDLAFNANAGNFSGSVWAISPARSGTSVAPGRIMIGGIYNNFSTTATVTFNANGGSGTMAAQTTGSAALLSSNTFTRSGYSFSGWNTLANGSGTGYGNAGLYGFSGNMTLYAQWTANSYSISSNVSQPGGTPGASSYTTGQPFTLPSAPTQTGCVFNGWLITGPNISTVTTLPSATTATVVGYGPLTLTVQWLAVTPPTSSGSGSSGTGTAGTGSAGSGGSLSTASGLSAGGLATTGVDLRSVLLGALTLLGIGTLLRMVSIRRDA